MIKNTLLFALMILIGVIIYYFFQSGLIKFYDPCEESIEIYDLIFEGIVVEKVDARQNFRSRYLLVKNDAEGSQIELELLGDDKINKATGRSLFWEIVDVGDSVSKKKETFVVSYKNEKSGWISMKLGFALCPD